MNLEKIIAVTKKKKYTIVKQDDLKELLSQSKIVMEKDTHIGRFQHVRPLPVDFILVIGILMIALVDIHSHFSAVFHDILEIMNSLLDPSHIITGFSQSIDP